MDCLVSLMSYRRMTLPAIRFQLKCLKRACEGVCLFFGVYQPNIESMKACERPSSCPLSFMDFIAWFFSDFDVCTVQETIFIVSKIQSGYSLQWNFVFIIFYDYNSVG